MTSLHPPVPLVAAPPPTPGVLSLLEQWLPTQRWYPLKGSGATLTPWASLAPMQHSSRAEQPAANPQQSRKDVDSVSAQVVFHMLRATGGGRDTVVHVPLVLTSTVLPNADLTSPDATGMASRGDVPTNPDAGHLGEPGHISTPGPVVKTGYIGESDGVHVYDGAAHPAGWAALLHAATWAPGAPEVGAEGGRAMNVEQSNSSVLLPSGQAILKILRTLAPGANLEVTVPRALSDAGWAGVPRPYGWVRAPWPTRAGPAAAGPAPTVAGTPFAGTTDPGTTDPGTTDPSDQGTHLAIVSEFVAGAADGFDLACRAAAEGRSFTKEAGELGRTIAGMHAGLRRAFAPGPTVVADALIADLRRRAQEAIGAAASLRARETAIEEFWRRTQAALRRPLPPTQTIHGDLHLGQVMRAGERWVVLDFEGEPMRPPAERSRPDLALRDVAGMLRSFDYAQAVGAHARIGQAGGTGTTGPTGAPVPTDAPASTSVRDDGAPYDTWASAAKQAFWENYAHDSHVDPAADLALVQALVLDKALYEVVYEARNRPEWEHIPLAAVDEIVGQATLGATPRATSPGG